MKKFLLWLTAFVFLSAFVLGAAAPAAYAQNGDEIRASKKIISVVYDDSGSMCGERWSYTNYAMQALIALLNEQDELYITFMSDPQNCKSFDTHALDSSIKKIRGWTDCGGTPGETLDTAYKKLTSIKESDATAQFWMIIMTDGMIAMNSTLQNKLDSYKNNKMSNGTMLNVVYLAMGAAGAAKEDRAGHLYTFEADSDEEIVGSMRDIANLVSGRLAPDSIAQTDATTITVTSKLPLYSISVLSQKSDAEVKEAYTSEEKLNVARNLKLDATNLSPLGVPLDKLYGNASVINKKGTSGKYGVIPAGTYTIRFSSEVDINTMTIQVEPAIGLKAEISRNGVVIDDTSKLANGDVVDIRIIPVVPGTDDEIDKADLPKQIAWHIEYEVDGNVVDSGSGMELKGVTLISGSNIVRGIIDIPGYAPFISEVYFTIAEIVHNFGIEVIQPSGLTYNRGDLHNLSLTDANTVKFRLTDDGKALTREEQKSFGVKLEIASVDVTRASDKNFVNWCGRFKTSCKLVQNDDGSYSLDPSCSKAVPILMIIPGDYTVTVKVSLDDSITEEGRFTITASKEDAKDLPKILIGLLIFLYLLYILFIKKKFSGQTVHYEVWRLQANGTGVQQKGRADSMSLGFLSGGLLLPWNARVSFKNLDLVAEGDGVVLVTGKSIAKAAVKYGRSNSNPADDLGSIVDSLTDTVKPNKERAASDQELTGTPLYFKSGSSPKEVWRIWLT